jgi:hypothetical protein
MNSEPSRPPSDSDLDRLLGSKLRRTSPAFELRWRELRGELAGTRPPRRATWLRWFLSPALPVLAAASLAVVLLIRQNPPAAPAPTASAPVTFEELLALDATLQPARPLLLSENRDALLHLPAQPRS